jgi:hypothetical protein
MHVYISAHHVTCVLGFVCGMYEVCGQHARMICVHLFTYLCVCSSHVCMYLHACTGAHVYTCVCMLAHVYAVE